MPKSTKDTEKKENIKKNTDVKVPKKTTTKKVTETTKLKAKTTATKRKTATTTKSKSAATAKKITGTKTSSNKTTSKAKKVDTVKKKTATTSKRKTTAKAKKIDTNIVAEYYDLPYRYNETVVKILYQTPNILFVYWDISDNDRNNFIAKYGEHFFYNTKPILKIYNLTKKYNFEIEINDFANSWYINVNDANCDYKVELARKTIKYEENIANDYTYVTSSNDIISPNDHILFDELPNNINFKNVKNGSNYLKNISTMHLVGINKIYNIQDFYKKFYKDEILDELNNKKLINPSSSSWA